MTWHLKDRELEKKLNELSNGEFSKILNESDTKDPNCICFTVDKKEDIELSVYLRPEAIEPEYDPLAWNEYPDVTPPEGVLMRVEFILGGTLYRNCSIFEKGAWRLTKNGVASYDITLDGIKRFRPWED